MRCVVALDVPDKRCKPSSQIQQPLPRTYPSSFVKNDKGWPSEGGLVALRYVKALAYCCCLRHRYSTAAITFFHVKALAYCCCLCHRYSTAAITFFHHRCVSLAGCLFGMIAIPFAWIAHSLLSSKRWTRYASEASWRARTAVLCICKSDFKLVARHHYSTTAITFFHLGCVALAGCLLAWSSMDCTLIAVFKEVNKVCFQSFMEGKKGRALYLQIRLQIGSNLFDKMLEGCLSDQKVSVLLVFMDLTNGDGPRVVMMGFLHAPHVSSLLLCSLCCKMMAWGLSPSWLACGLLCSGHCLLVDVVVLVFLCAHVAFGCCALCKKKDEASHPIWNNPFMDTTLHRIQYPIPQCQNWLPMKIYHHH
jgi:hypothetical protein